MLDLPIVGIPKVKAHHHLGSSTMHELQVEGMSCNHCVSKVTRAVKAIDDAAKVEVELASKMVRVASAVDFEDLVAAITEAGYVVQSGNIR